MIIVSEVCISLLSQLVDDLIKIDYLINKTAYFELKWPELLIILNDNYIVLKAVQMFAQLEFKVTILQWFKYVLFNLEHDISICLTKHFRDKEIDVEVGVNITSVISDENKVVIKDTFEEKQWTFMTFRVFLVTDHCVNAEHISDLLLKVISMLHDRFMVLNTLQTSISKVYTADDCVADSLQYIYTATVKEQLTALNALRTLFD